MLVDYKDEIPLIQRLVVECDYSEMFWGASIFLAGDFVRRQNKNALQIITYHDALKAQKNKKNPECHLAGC